MSENQPATPELPKSLEPEPVPTWTRDFLRVLGIALFGALFLTLLIWFASTGLMRDKSLTDTIDADAVWAGICAGLMPVLFPVLFMEHKRLDNGFRREGLIPLIILSVVCGAVIVTVVTMTWPLFLGERAVPGTVAAELSGDPASVFLVLCFFIGGMAWCLTIMMPMMIGGFKVALWLLVPYLGFVFLSCFAGVRVFDNPPNFASAVIWAAVALSGLAALTGIAALRNVIDKPDRQMSYAERARAYQQFMEERRRRGLTNESPLPGIDGRQSHPPADHRPGPPQRPPYPPRPPQGPRR